MRISHFLLSTAVVLGLAACTRPDGIRTVSSLDDRYDSDDYAHEASVKPILVVVRGTAFGLDQKALESTITENMQGADWGPHAKFTTTPGSDVAPIFSFVMLVNGPQNATAASLCRDPTKAPASTEALPAGEIRLLGGLCRYDQNMSEVTGRIDGVSGPQDPKFHNLIVAAMQELTTPMTTQRLMHDTGGNDSGGPSH
jgi:hypothetical protein